MRTAAWFNGKTYLYGWFEYHWRSDNFTVVLDSIDDVTGQRRTIRGLYGDSPEWGNWKMVTDANCPWHEYDGNYCKWCSHDKRL